MDGKLIKKQILEELKNKVSEAERLAKMNKEQKLEYQAQKERTDKDSDRGRIP